MESISGSLHQAWPLTLHRAWATLLCVLFVDLNSRSCAQTDCGITRTNSLRVENATGVGMLRAAATCTDSGSLEAEWSGAITLDTPISIARGTFLSVTGADTFAEVRGGSQTRMFEVSQGGGLTLTQLKLSGGAAEGGGAIYSDSAALILDSCRFHGNVATKVDGGAVWADGGNVTIVGGEFVGNNATTGFGGAVATTTVARLVIQEGSIFEDNKAIVGGALFCSGVAESGLASCSLINTEFASNNATGDTEWTALLDDFSEGVDGGGAVALQFASADVTDSVFRGNYAERSGGALLGGSGTDVTVNGCKFENNTAVYGGAISATSMTLGGNTQLSYNSADEDGGAVLGWDSKGAIIFNAVTCTQNVAVGYGGCFRGAGKDVVNDGTIMHNNSANHGGCIYAHEGSELKVVGGDFMGRSNRRAGFLMVGGGTRVTVTGGLIANNVAGDRGGAVYCSGRGQTTFTVEGGTFRNNTAREYGGAIAAWGPSTSVHITGGMFTNNTAKYNGGCLYLDGEASLTCEGSFIVNNSAGDQGGGIYARDATWVDSSCDLIANQAPRGAALYLAGVTSVTLQNLTITSNVALSGGMLYMTETSVVANGVSFISGIIAQGDTPSRAVQSDSNSAFNANKCVFDGWLGDTVIYHRSSGSDSLSLDSCDFRGSSAVMAAFSLNSDAKIRNAVVDDSMLANAGRVNDSLALVNRALDCSSHDLCGPGECVDNVLGVLCECLDDDTCLNDCGGVSLVVKTPPASKTYLPDMVSFELVVSSAGDGTTYTIWDLGFQAKDLTLDVAPPSGILPPGGSTTVVVTGIAATQAVGGLTSRFNLTTVGSTSSILTAGVTLEVNSTFYFCLAYKYADPLTAEDDDWSCEPCISISGGEGVDCTSPGATLTSLPLRQGYWRAGRESLVVHKCGISEACAGATNIERGRLLWEWVPGAIGFSNTCHSCDNTNGQRLIWMSVIVSVVVILLFLIFAVVFLVGGLDAVNMVRRSVTRSVYISSKTSKVWSVSHASRQGRHYPERGTKKAYANDDITPAFDITRENQLGAGERDTGHRSRESASTSPGPEDSRRAYVRPSGAFAGVGTHVGLSDVGMPGGPHARLETSDGGKSKCSWLGVSIKTWASQLPLNKFKILVVVWQILTVFSSITGVEFPESYSKFLSWVNFVNFDIGHIFSASCVFPSVNFYSRLLLTTLVPLVLVVVLLLTYHMAKRRVGIGSAGVVARNAAWSRHVAAGLLLTFLVFTSASTLVFKTFACDAAAVDGKSYLRADYSILCGSSLHTFFKGYAGFMILVYPVGIPALYAVILWRKRELLNPRTRTKVVPEPEETDGTSTIAECAERAGLISSFLHIAAKGQGTKEMSPQELQDFGERVRARRDHPELAPSMFLWKAFGPDLFYHEVLECGRRIRLTGVLVFIAPNSSTQVAAACFFAFVSLLGFELLRPHLDSADTCIYRLGGVVIFLSYFLALLINVDAAGEDGRSALADTLVAINVVLVLAVFLAPWFPTQHRAATGG